MTLADYEEGAPPHESTIGFTTEVCTMELRNQVQVQCLVIFLKSVKAFADVWTTGMVRRWRTRRRRRKVAQEEDSATLFDPTTGTAKMSRIVQRELEKAPYGSLGVDGTFQDYVEVCMLFGHVCLFSLAFPLAPFIGTCCLFVEMRLDGLKMFIHVRRPIPRGEESIGSWVTVLQGLAWVSVFVQTMLLVFSEGALDAAAAALGVDRRPAWLALVLCILMMKAAVLYVVPKVPHNLEIIEDHHEHLRLTSIGSRRFQTVGSRSLVEALDTSVQVGSAGVGRCLRDFGQCIASPSAPKKAA